MAMPTLVIGAGLSGLATAQVLAERGAAVRVLEAREGVALETSYANAGMLTPSMPEPWNGPGVYRDLAASLIGSQQSMRVRWRTLPSLARWGLSFLRNSSAPRYQAAVRDNYALASYSREKTLALVDHFGSRYALLDTGTLCVSRSAGDLAARRDLCTMLERHGLCWREVGREELVALEPALADVAERLSGGIWLPDDAVGDAQLFCRELAREVTAGGGHIDTRIAVSGLVVRNGSIAGVDTSHGRIDAQRVVVAAGARSPGILRHAGLSLPVKPAKGYSLTFDCRNVDGVPGVALVDEAAHAVITPFADRFRVVGFAEFAGFDRSIATSRMDTLYAALESLLPGLAAKVDRAAARPWCGFRPMSSDGRPHVGATGIGGLFLNAGHGALGWTMAMGSAHLLADLVFGDEPAIDARPFQPLRR
jgi:D-amino-acid dehydrogenase